MAAVGAMAPRTPSFVPAPLRAAVWLFAMLLPWALRRMLLEKALGYHLHPTSHIGISLVLPKRLVMGAHSSIGALTVCKGLDLVELEESATIGRLNWITAYPSNDARFFSTVTDRKPNLRLGQHSAITSRHLIDCTA